MSLYEHVGQPPSQINCWREKVFFFPIKEDIILPRSYSDLTVFTSDPVLPAKCPPLLVPPTTKCTWNISPAIAPFGVLHFIKLLPEVFSSIQFKHSGGFFLKWSNRTLRAANCSSVPVEFHIYVWGFSRESTSRRKADRRLMRDRRKEIHFKSRDSAAGSQWEALCDPSWQLHWEVTSLFPSGWSQK